MFDCIVAHGLFGIKPLYKLIISIRHRSSNLAKIQMFSFKGMLLLFRQQVRRRIDLRMWW